MLNVSCEAGIRRLTGISFVSHEIGYHLVNDIGETVEVKVCTDCV